MPVPIISVAEMREWEQFSWAAGLKESEVIARVGRIVAARTLQLTKAGDIVLLLAGKGHNGDDVRQAQPHLTGREVMLLDVTDPSAALAELPARLAKKPALVIDGLFGIGLNRPLEGDWAKLVELINQADLPVLAVDVPSGLNADTGAVLGAAVRASVTLTLGAPKRGLLTPEAASVVGCLEVAPEIGLTACPAKNQLNWTLPGDFSGYPPPRATLSHKGTYGHLVMVAGSVGYHGAAVMAARAALRAMPGLVSLLSPENVYAPIASQLDAVMVHPLRLDHPLIEEGTALLLGPGLADPKLPADVGLRFNQIWRNSLKPMIVDASALAWLGAGAIRSQDNRVITPHPGEAASMLRVTTADIQKDRVNALRELSRRYGHCWVVLKGHQTLVGRSSGDVFVNPSGNPGLAQGGTGDVLAGYLAGLLVQPGLRDKDFFKVLRYAVWQHGATADFLAARQRVWTVEDLLSQLGNITPEN